MNPTPKTIQIFLPAGDPRGIRIAEITTRIVQVIEVPRSLLGEFLAMNEARQVAVYFLFGAGDDEESARVYIGQTGDLPARLASHHRDKEFWERAVVLISRTNSLTQTHALYLEWHCLQQAREAGRYADDNGNSGNKPYTPAPMEADCHEIFDTGRTLLTTLGYPLFTPIREVASEGSRRVYHCVGRGAVGRGVYSVEGFTVLAGSSGPIEMTPSLAMSPNGAVRTKLVERGVVRVEGDRLIFPADHAFRTPSAAAVALLGRAANGWIEWKLDDGRTLGEVERSAIAES